MKKKCLFISLLLVITLFVGSLQFAEAATEKSKFIGNLTCGDVAQDGRGITFHKSLPIFTNRIYDILKVATPVVIIITGMLDILKATTAQKEDDLKKAQKKFLNRLLIGMVVFLVFVIIELVVNLVSPDNATNAMNCVECFLSDHTKCQTITEK